MEASSENGWRGRPKAFSERELDDAKGDTFLSRRQLQNRALARRARLRLAGLWGKAPEGMPVPQCVLAELGRIEDRAGFDRVAEWYREFGRDLSAKQAAAKIKDARIGRIPQEGPATLYERLVRTVEEFRVDYPDASPSYVEGQMELVLGTVRWLRRCDS